MYQHQRFASFCTSSKKIENYALEFLIAQKHLILSYYFTQASSNISTLVDMTEYGTLYKLECTETMDEHYIVIVTAILFLCLRSY